MGGVGRRAVGGSVTRGGGVRRCGSLARPGGVGPRLVHRARAVAGIGARLCVAAALRGVGGGVGELVGHGVGDAGGRRGVLRHGGERLSHVGVVVAGLRVAVGELLESRDVLVAQARGVVVDGDLGHVDGGVVDDRRGVVHVGGGVVHVRVVGDVRVVHDVVHRGVHDGVDLGLVGDAVHHDAGLHVVHDERGGVASHLAGDALRHHELLGGDILLRGVERSAGGRLIGEHHAGEGAGARHLEGADGDDVGVAHAGRGERRGQHVGRHVVQVGRAHVDAARAGGADERAAVGGVADLLVGHVAVEVGVLVGVGDVDDLRAVHARAEVVDHGLALLGGEVGADGGHDPRVSEGGRHHKRGRHHGSGDGAGDATGVDRGKVHGCLLTGMDALSQVYPPHIEDG